MAYADLSRWEITVRQANMRPPRTITLDVESEREVARVVAFLICEGIPRDWIEARVLGRTARFLS